jgi:hypothetical protein
MQVKTVAVVLVLLAAGAVSWRSSTVLAAQCTNSLLMPQSGLDQTGTGTASTELKKEYRNIFLPL